MKKLPIGIQTFKDIRKDDYIYIDKTEIALELIKSFRYSFLARPRRFGKSLFLDTLQNIFEGNRELFLGLYIYDKWDFDVRYPVIKISWDGDLRSEDGLKNTILSKLRSNQERLQIECFENSYYTVCFEELIKKAYKKYNQKVVILIDEYDKPILDNLDQMEVAKEAREILKSFYSIIKNQDEYIRFAFLTGVSKFSKASIFSGLNMLVDISLDKRYGNVCGYTQKDLEDSFKEWLIGANMQKVKDWYNGYNFLGDDMYNPFDILNFLAKDKTFDNYWFATGTPTFLMKLIESNNYFLPNLSNLVVDKRLLDSFDIENLDLEVVLYQTGYLTIESVEIDEEFDTIEYKLKIPNREVRESFSQFIISYLYHDKSPMKKSILIALRDRDLESFKNALKSIFASIPYNNYVKNKMQYHEGFYASVVYIYLQSLGIEIIGEDVTNKSRIDLTIKFANAVYILEFKVCDENPLEQIKEKRYFEKYLVEYRDIFLVGVVFDVKEKNIREFVWERV